MRQNHVLRISPHHSWVVRYEVPPNSKPFEFRLRFAPEVQVMVLTEEQYRQWQEGNVTKFMGPMPPNGNELEWREHLPPGTYYLVIQNPSNLESSGVAQLP